ncbi:MAG: hypothetical protein RSC76_00005, partial [Oscillospiraceae bacterium]
MAIRASNQLSVLDLTDGYSVILTNESHTFLGTTNSVSGTQTTTCMVQALCGEEVKGCSVGAITAPAGLSIVSDGKTPTPTLTITATSALTQSGSVVIPVTIGEVTISKTFSYSIAFRGSNGSSVAVSNTSVTYQLASSGTITPTGAWVTEIPAVPAGQYLWTRTVVTYSDGKSTTAYSISRNGTNGSNGSSITVTNTAVTYQVSDSGTVTPTGAWVSVIPATSAGQYLWTKTVVTYSDGKTIISYSISRNGSNGSNGSNGQDAISMVIMSSNGTIFKNTHIATTLSAHIYKGGVEVSGAALTALGTIQWYK